MKIIGHRGAAGLALENTLESLKKAVELGVDAVEFDVRLTRDRKLVLCHDDNLSKVSLSHAKIDNLDLEELKRVKLKNGKAIPTLEEALGTVGSTQAIIEVKVEDCADELLEVIDKFPKANVAIASFKHKLAAQIKKLRPDLKVYLAGFIGPSETFKAAQRANADGLDLNAWALNIITYRLARRAGMEIMVYTINQPWVARFIHKFYPDVSIVTDFPDKFIQRGKAKD